MKIPLSYYLSDDVVSLAKSFIGKSLFTKIDGKLTGGIITETEAYAGIIDRASHAFGGRRTKRTEVMYQSGGVSYVYLCYGIHSMFNIVTNKRGIPHAVLVRAIYPTTGWEEIQKRSGKLQRNYTVTNGPGKLTKALGIDLKHNSLLLNENIIWLENNDVAIDNLDILSTKRIGIEYAGEDELLYYRFVLKI